MRPNSPNKKERLRAKGWFLTYPRCEVSKEEALSILHQTGPISEYVVAKEDHADGVPHLHSFIKYETKQEFKERKWDLKEHHGNY